MNVINKLESIKHIIYLDILSNQEPVLNPCDDYEIEKSSVSFRLNRHPFSTNYLFEVDERYIYHALSKISDENGFVNINDIIPYFSAMKPKEKALAGKVTQLKKTENYSIFKVYINWEFDKIKNSLLSSNIDLTKDIRLDLHFGALAKYDVDGLAKGFIDAFAEYFMNGEDHSIKELSLSMEPVINQKDGFIDLTISNI